MVSIKSKAGRTFLAVVCGFAVFALSSCASQAAASPEPEPVPPPPVEEELPPPPPPRPEI